MTPLKIGKTGWQAKVKVNKGSSKFILKNIKDGSIVKVWDFEILDKNLVEFKMNVVKFGNDANQQKVERGVKRAVRSLLKLLVKANSENS